MKNVHEGGFGLIEVLITLIVLAVGLVALAKFQGTAIESGSLAKARTVATHLAQQKLDDLRNYACLTEADADPGDPDPPLLSPCLTKTAAATGSIIACGATTKARYDCIENNKGGNKAGGALLLPDGDTTVSNVTYKREWEVTDYCFPQDALGKTPNKPAEKPCPAPPLAPAFPDFKQVTVKVGWTDQDGVGQNCDRDRLINCVVLRSIINASDPLYSGRILE